MKYFLVNDLKVLSSYDQALLSYSSVKNFSVNDLEVFILPRSGNADLFFCEEFFSE